MKSWKTGRTKKLLFVEQILVKIISSEGSIYSSLFIILLNWKCCLVHIFLKIHSTTHPPKSRKILAKDLLCTKIELLNICAIFNFALILKGANGKYFLRLKCAKSFLPIAIRIAARFPALLVTKDRLRTTERLFCLILNNINFNKIHKTLGTCKLMCCDSNKYCVPFNQLQF